MVQLYRLSYEIISDYLYVVITLVAAVAVVIYMWARYNKKSGGRYKT